jgi:HD-GYP domain-containing protein (c-di-GMP phosphodiesterase class II)
VDRDIINAPYHIDAKKSSELNRHPSAGYEILAPIRHPYADIPLMAKHHHERLDGRGYPDGLTDQQIPIGAKIVSLADSFDAMTTDRPYRRRRSFEDVVIDLRENSGKQFDGKVVGSDTVQQHGLARSKSETAGRTLELDWHSFTKELRIG